MSKYAGLAKERIIQFRLKQFFLLVTIYSIADSLFALLGHMRFIVIYRGSFEARNREFNRTTDFGWSCYQLEA